MAWKLVNPNITNDPSYLDPRLSDDESKISSNTTSLAEKATVVQYSQLGSISALVNALANGTSVDLDRNINLDQVITLYNSKLYSSNKSKITLTNSNAGIVITDNSGFYDQTIIQDSSITFSKPAIIVTNHNSSTDFLNSKIRNLTLTLNQNTGSVGLQIYGVGTHIFGFTMSEYTISGANKGIEFLIDGTHTGWINGNHFTNGHIYNYLYAVYTNIVGAAWDYCAANVFTNLTTQTSAASIKAIYDIGDNVYTNLWAFDLNAPAFNNPNKNGIGIINGSNNLYNSMSSPTLTSTAISQASTNYFRIGYFDTSGVMTDKYVELKFYGPNGDKGNMRININSSNIATATVTSNELLNNMNIYTHLCDDGTSVALFLQLKGTLNGWCEMSIYERYEFTMEDYGCMAFTPTQMSGLTLTPATVVFKTRQETSDALKSLFYTTTQTINTGAISANSSYNFVFSDSNILATDIVSAYPTVLEAGLVWSCYVPSAGQMVIRIANITAATITPASRTWNVNVIHKP